MTEERSLISKALDTLTLFFVGLFLLCALIALYPLNLFFKFLEKRQVPRSLSDRLGLPGW